MSVHAAVDEVVDTIGYSAFESLVAARGGTAIFVPREPTAQLVQWLGAAAAEKLCAQFAGCRVQVPNFKRAPSLRDRVASLLPFGMTEADMALALDCTEQAIRKHKKALREEDAATVAGGNADAAMNNETRFATGHSSSSPQPPGPGGSALSGPKGG